MAAIGWAALFVFFTSIMSLGRAGYEQNVTAAWVLLGIATVSALVVMWAFGVLDRRATRKPVSPYFERQQALSTLDRRDGVGNRKANQ